MLGVKARRAWLGDAEFTKILQDVNKLILNKTIMQVKKGDKVKVIAGKEKGKTTTVARVLKETNQVVLDGLNMVKRHTKPKKAGDKGGIIEIPQPIHASNVKKV